jgi:ADP-dependent NAD(P)H-hydrate dehydratase
MNQPPVRDSLPVDVHPGMLTEWPLPMPSNGGDKETRGRVLIIGGSAEIPGGAILAATGALRAGAGKVAIATVDTIAPHIAIAVPEARVIALPATASGSIGPGAASLLDSICGKVDVVLIGPGMEDEPTVCALIRDLLPRLSGVKVLLDACAMGVVMPQPAPKGAGGPSPCFAEGSDLPVTDTIAGQPAERHEVAPVRFKEPVLLTPHAGEMSHLTGMDKDAVQADPILAAADAAKRWNAVVALKGATTFIAGPDGRIWRHARGNVGLAASGSGDVLAGIIAGLAARGASLEQACVWGVALHAMAGERLAERMGVLGYLAREIPAEIPALMEVSGSGTKTPGATGPDK